MRLLHTKNLVLEEFFDSDIPSYAILSHRWGKDEVSLQDFETGKKKSGEGYKKIMNCCNLARQRGHKWVWIDTCCLDKKSSAELSEAINSMFRWYQKAEECYAFLNDVDWSPSTSKGMRKQSLAIFRQSRWFTRGWTLQELLAPYIVLFYDMKWEYIDTRKDLASEISKATGIPNECLVHTRSALTKCVAQKMSWVARRQTSRIEDMTYCLLGLFDINMPLLYGEGHKAFLRLQLEIVQKSYDESIFAWFDPLDAAPSFRYPSPGIFARSPINFAESGEIRSCRGFRPPWSVTNRGLAIHVPASEIDVREMTAAIRLNCVREVVKGDHAELNHLVINLRENIVKDSSYYRTICVFSPYDSRRPSKSSYDTCIYIEI